MKKYENPSLEVNKIQITDIISASADDVIIKDNESDGSFNAGGLNKQ